MAYRDLMFATRAATADELNHLRALLSTFRDGSGNQKESDGTTRASWREIERCIAELVSGPASENKHIFDVLAQDQLTDDVFYGLSIKSKQLTKKNFSTLGTTGRLHMEIANSPAKFWKEIHEKYGYSERHFQEQKHASDIGECVLHTVQSWHEEGKITFELSHPGKTLDIDHSKYLCVSYSDSKIPSDRLYQVHSFSLKFPAGIIWKYTSDRRLRGFDPRHPTEALFDWYGSSGGQLKYYPRAIYAENSSPAFYLLSPPDGMSLTEKAKVYFPDMF